LIKNGLGIILLQTHLVTLHRSGQGFPLKSSAEGFGRTLLFEWAKFQRLAFGSDEFGFAQEIAFFRNF
jgi:hypothetical protein